jgi:hypothetical protein
MGVRVREKPKGSGIYWIFINHKGRRKSKKIGDEKTANEVAKKIKSEVEELDQMHPNAPYTQPDYNELKK